MPARKKGVVTVRFGKSGRRVPVSERTYSRTRKAGNTLYEDRSTSRRPIKFPAPPKRRGGR